MSPQTPPAGHAAFEVFPGPRVAVLPFLNLSEDPEQGYFCDGMAVEILLSLARAPRLNVIARSAVFALRNENLSSVEAGRRLDATAVLAGKVQRADGRVRVEVDLIDIASGRRLWSGTFDRDLVDVFFIQDEIARAVVEALEVDGPARSIRSAQTGNVAAYDSYLLGRQRYYDYSR
ncbi:MAG: hypothetical protein R3178_06850, partial [Rhodothermales bacterium]|nr:hypothetical protein [Rhodothermales bacterium]